MSTLHIMLASGENLPNLIPAIVRLENDPDFKADTALILSSRGMRQRGNAETLKSALETADVKNVTIHPEDCPDHDLAEMRQWAKAKADVIAENYYGSRKILNLTGGNKLMTLAFWEAFQDSQAEIIYCDTEHNNIEYIQGNKNAQRLPVNVLNLDTCLAAQGYTSRPDGTDLEGIQKRKGLTRTLAKSAPKINGLIHALNTAFFDFEKSASGTVLTDKLWAKEKGLLAKIQQLDLLQGNTLKDENAARYLGGGWLEEWCWQVGKELEQGEHDKCLQSNRWSINRKIDAIGNLRQNAPYPLNELDAVFLHRNPKKVLEAVRRFKNDKFPNIAVTVDLLTTGIDVPEITTLVFMRRVKSRILFEQMLGRATRLCPAIGKTQFEIYDPVGAYESLEPVNSMKPVVRNESASFDDLLDGLKILDEKARAKNQIDLIVARIRRKNRGLDETALKEFSDLSGGLDPGQFIKKLAELPLGEARALLLESARLLRAMESGGAPPARAVVLSDKPDELRSHTRGYGNAKTPEDYLREFTAFVTGNINTIAALNVVCTRPRELTREALKTLRLELDKAGYTETRLNTAWRESKNEDIAADIIGFIRRGAIGSALIPHKERIQKAVDRLRRAHDFNAMERKWIDRIEKALLSETIIDREIFDTGAFKDQGGFARIDKVFSGHLNACLDELNDYLYDDGELAA